METKTLYTISTIKQLISVNNTAINFDCKLKITSLDGKPFESTVLTQTDLDTMEQLPFERDLHGVFSAEMHITKNQYEPYYLVVRAPEQRTIEVTLQLQQLPDFIPQNQGVLLERNTIVDNVQNTVQHYQKWIWMFGAAAILILGVWFNRSPIGSVDGIKIARGARPSLLSQLKTLKDAPITAL